MKNIFSLLIIYLLSITFVFSQTKEQSFPTKIRALIVGSITNHTQQVDSNGSGETVSFVASAEDLRFFDKLKTWDAMNTSKDWFKNSGITFTFYRVIKGCSNWDDFDVKLVDITIGWLHIKTRNSSGCEEDTDALGTTKFQPFFKQNSSLK